MNTIKTSGNTDWERLKKMKDSEIDYSDIPLTDEKFWSDAKIVHHKKKVDLTIQLDEDIVLWLNRLRGYDLTINSILRNYFNTVMQMNEMAESNT